MPDAWLIVSIVVKFKEDTVRVDDSVFLEPGWEYFVFKQVLSGINEGIAHDNWCKQWCNESSSEWYSEVFTLERKFGWDEVIENWDVLEGLK